jgi:endonuclease/exonuclease/phosphatase family metal-dependent hydrolase
MIRILFFVVLCLLTLGSSESLRLNLSLRLGLSEAGAANVPTANTSAAKVQIVTMNIQCFAGNWKFRLSRILDTFIELSPDVIGLQEVCEDRVNNVSQIEFIRSYLSGQTSGRGYNIQGLEAQLTHQAWGQYEESLVLLTKLKVSAVDKGLLPPSLLQRGYVAFQINRVWYVNTHLEYLPENALARRNQFEFLMGRFAGQDHIIGGDFNSSPDSEEQAELKKRGYFDIFPGDSHLGSSGDSTLKIDGFWISPKLRSAISRISSEIFLNQKVQDQYLSDHFAVRAELQF